MKQLFLTLLFGGFCSGLFAQKMAQKDVPSAAVTAFTKLFPTAQTVQWEKEDGKYEADFQINKISMSAVFEDSGTLVETETKIEANALPATVRAYLSKNYDGFQVVEATKIDSKGVLTYEAEIQKKSEKFELIFDAAGSLLRKKVKKADED